jgi:hypothetical protein
MTTADWLLAALVILWVVMAPIYHPYFRLLVPFTLATMVLAGAALAGLSVARTRSTGTLLGSGIALSDAAAAMDATLPPGSAVSVLGEPALAFYLHRRGHPSFERTTMEALDTLTEARYVVAGIYMRRAPRVRERIAARGDRMTLVGRFPLGRPSDLRLLDDFRPDAAGRWMARPDTTYDLLLFRYRPPGAGAP